MNSDKMARKFEKHYASHGAAVKLTLYEIVGGGERLIFDLKIKKGTKESLVFDRASDIRTALGLPLFQPFKEGLSIRLAVSERPVTENSLIKMLTNPVFRKIKTGIPIALGYDMRGEMRYADFSKFPHALYAGSSGSGKTSGLRSLILSIVVKNPVNKVNLLIADTGASGLDLFNALPHLSYPIIKDEETVIKVMLSLIVEMERRITLSDDELRLLPAIIFIIDEYISLVTNIGNIGEKKTLSDAISTLLRRGRHAKIYLTLATQESAKQDMLINLNNINARMAFRCSDFYSSRAILGEAGAEKLPGNGALLFKHPAHPKPMCIQGAFMSSGDIEQLISRIVSKNHDFGEKFVISENELSQPQTWTSEGLDNKPSKSDINKELAEIILWALGRENISLRQIQQNFRMGNRAAAVVEELSRMNIVADKFSNQPRLVLPTCYEDLSAEVIKFLNNNGYTEEYVKEAFNLKGEV